MAYTTIKVTDEVKRKLIKLAGEIQAKKGEEISLNDVIELLIDFYENKRKIKKGLKMNDFDGLIIEMDTDSSEKVDEVVYGKSTS
ncbi:hypothetical protein [Sulfurisphaera tokodaii]|uniref:VapB-type antitoxin n=2 Tax=Sulfurisphaera tokodaii TaxID=111955 RepID=F9VNJ6_SULTO|nr:hypothetical protein [Sulfurisphaera tokodaii]BAK54642.1 hypothetical protein STK_16880 [Sulfurisphaera tokodaii str. 7]HII73108.1 hypothetical protein [Sulfurisphaera tokodaii]